MICNILKLKGYAKDIPREMSHRDIEKKIRKVAPAWRPGVPREMSHRDTRKKYHMKHRVRRRARARGSIVSEPPWRQGARTALQPNTSPSSSSAWAPEALTPRTTSIIGEASSGAGGAAPTVRGCRGVSQPRATVA